MANKFWHKLCRKTKGNQNIKDMTEQNIINEELQKNNGASMNQETVKNMAEETAAEGNKNAENKENTEMENNTEETVDKADSQANGSETADSETNGSETNGSETAGNSEATEQEVDPLTKALAEIEELKTQMLYKQAEFDNFRKRTMKEKAELILNGGEKTVKAILPILDDFERAIAQAEKSDDVAALREGMQLIFKKFMKTLEGQGVQKMNTLGKEFNTDFHEAVALVPGMGEDNKGKVIDCVQTGYTLNDKVIRHAKVAVGQ